METALDYIIIVLRLLINVPIVYFFYKQWQLRKANGIIKIVRRLITWWVAAFFIQQNYLIVFRYFMANNSPANDTVWTDIVSLTVTIFIGTMTFIGVYLFHKIQKEHQ